jgi:hypothetical protein
MRKCQYCRKIFCRNCMVHDVVTGDPTIMFCLNCARRIVSPRRHIAYLGLTNHLKFRAAFTRVVKLSFAKIDGLIGTNLPMKAFRESAWWSNSASSVHAKAWLDAGWEVQAANLKEGYVIFKKVLDIPFKQSAHAKLKVTKPFTPVPVRLPRSKAPSKTKMSKTLC